jgi:hypothetical protein
MKQDFGGGHVVSCHHILVRNSRLWEFLCNSVQFSLPLFSCHPISFHSLTLTQESGLNCHPSS